MRELRKWIQDTEYSPLILWFFMLVSASYITNTFALLLLSLKEIMFTWRDAMRCYRQHFKIWDSWQQDCILVLPEHVNEPLNYDLLKLPGDPSISEITWPTLGWFSPLQLEQWSSITTDQWLLSTLFTLVSFMVSLSDTYKHRSLWTEVQEPRQSCCHY